MEKVIAGWLLLFVGFTKPGLGRACTCLRLDDSVTHCIYQTFSCLPVLVIELTSYRSIFPFQENQKWAQM